jgi:hypothetical protein
MDINEILTKNLNFIQNNCLKPYLKEVFNDLATNSSDKTKKLTLDLKTFKSYMNPMAFFLSERLFEYFKTNKVESNLTCDDFTKGLLGLYYGEEKELLDILFFIIDFNHNNTILFKDIKILTKILNLEECIANVLLQNLKQIFGQSDLFTRNEYEFVADKDTLFKPILDYIKDHRPFSEDSIKLYTTYNKKTIKQLKTAEIRRLSFHLKSLAIDDDEEDKKNLAELEEDIELDLTLPEFKRNMSKFCKVCTSTHLPTVDECCPKDTDIYLRSNFEVSTNYQNNTTIVDHKQASCIEDLTKSKTFTYVTPQKKFSEHFTSKMSIINLMDCLGNEDGIECDFKGVVYQMNMKKQMKRFMLVLKEKDLYFLKTSTKSYKGVVIISNCHIKESKQLKYREEIYFCFNIIYPNETKKFYTHTRSEALQWINEFKKCSGFRCIDDHYSLNNKLGMGSFSNVVIGEQINTNKKVAIKILSKSDNLNYDEELINSEVQILSFLSHKNIVGYIDHFEDDKNAYIITEYINGVDLALYLQNRKYIISEKEIKTVIYQLANAVKYLHSNGIIHRDIKPSNVMINNPKDNNRNTSSFGLQIKLIDFGLAKLILGGQTTERLGTLSFSAPEVLKGEKYSYKCDIWSLGVILYFLISGSLPYESLNELELMEQIINCDFYYTEIFKDEIVKDLISKCLTKNYSKRIDIEQFICHEWFRFI